MNPLYVAHRINTVFELKTVPQDYGVEVDLRDFGSDVVLQHDPFIGGESFESYLKEYQHKFLILNIKSEGIEKRVKELVDKYQVGEYFFLDCSFPVIHTLSKQGEKNIAVRFSEFESLATVMALKGLIRWVWVDCFSKLPITASIAKELRKAGFRICLVSPELQNRPHDLPKYADSIRENEIEFDAICTKIFNIPVWSQEYS